MVFKEIGKLGEKAEITPDAKKQTMLYICNFKVAEKRNEGRTYQKIKIIIWEKQDLLLYQSPRLFNILIKKHR